MLKFQLSSKPGGLKDRLSKFRFTAKPLEKLLNKDKIDNLLDKKPTFENWSDDEIFTNVDDEILLTKSYLSDSSITPVKEDPIVNLNENNSENNINCIDYLGKDLKNKSGNEKVHPKNSYNKSKTPLARKLSHDKFKNEFSKTEDKTTKRSIHTINDGSTYKYNFKLNKKNPENIDDNMSDFQNEPKNSNSSQAQQNEAKSKFWNDLDLFEKHQQQQKQNLDSLYQNTLSSDDNNADTKNNFGFFENNSNLNLGGLRFSQDHRPQYRTVEEYPHSSNYCINQIPQNPTSCVDLQDIDMSFYSSNNYDDAPTSSKNICNQVIICSLLYFLS